ncbi:MAG: RimK family alpha-L-glutamate ligase [Sphingomicrobium sp.]
MRIAVLVPDPDYPEPWQWAYDVEADALRRHGVIVHAVPWTDPDDLSNYDLILPLVAWGYHHDYGPWLRLLNRFDAERLPVVNPTSLLWWNSDKTYLTDLAAKGVPTVATIDVEKLNHANLAAAAARFGTPELVVKPPISASAAGTHRVRVGDAIPAAALGRRMIIQPFVSTIATEGEYALMLFDGRYSHTVVKRPAAGDFRVQEHFGGVTLPAGPPPGAIELARQALAAAPAHATYARVDIVPDDDGILRIMELELIEPALFLDHAPDGGEAFSQAILNAARTATA